MMPALRCIEVAIPSGTALLQGQLAIAPDALGIVAFAHGSGSSRFSRRNPQVAHSLTQARPTTFLDDLLTEYENARDERAEVGSASRRERVSPDMAIPVSAVYLKTKE